VGKHARGEVALMYGTVLSLVAAMACFLYVADPLLHHALNALWRLIAGA
jgi:preprotein translocase subunit SecE